MTKKQLYELRLHEEAKIDKLLWVMRVSGG